MSPHRGAYLNDPAVKLALHAGNATWLNNDELVLGPAFCGGRMVEIALCEVREGWGQNGSDT